MTKEEKLSEEKEMTSPISSTAIDEDEPLCQSNTKIITENTELSKEKFQHIDREKQIADLVKKIRHNIGENAREFPRNDVGASRMFYECFKNEIAYVHQSKSWYLYNGMYWVKDNGKLHIMELVKMFVMAYNIFAMTTKDEELTKYSSKLFNRGKRDNIIKDACSINPKSFTDFDSNPHLFNCKNGTYNLETLELQDHSPLDYITKISNVIYSNEATCERWESFVSEIMNGNDENIEFLQKAFGYALSGETKLECFFIFYGSTTRNGKSTACETIANLLGDYATNAQAKSLAKNNRDGSSATPDIARLKGARYVTLAEPEKGLELDVSLIKQLTGGDKYTGRFLNENPIEFVPEFKIFINTNHLPRVSDDTIFSSERVKILPFERHFDIEEQDTSLKDRFKQEDMISGIFHWLVDGYVNLQMNGLIIPKSVMEATKEYREESDTIGTFLENTVCVADDGKVKTSALYKVYKNWCLDNGYRTLNNKNFVAEMRKKYEVRRSGTRGNEIVGIDLLPKDWKN